MPLRALSTPLFVVALAVLAVNDHVLKGTGLLPGWLTGKLSDFAGLVVAPVVLAVLLRTRTTLGFALCNVVAATFLAAIKISPRFDTAWGSLMEVVGFEWHTTPDTTDLLAVIVQIPAWKVLAGAMRSPPTSAQAARMQRMGGALLWPTAAWVLMATSPQPIVDPCANARTTVTEALPLDEPPAIGGGLSGQEMLDFVANSASAEFRYTPPDETNPGCPSLGDRPPTTITAEIVSAADVARHENETVDESSASEECLESDGYVPPTVVRVAVVLTLASADGDVLTTHDIELSSHGWSDVFGWWSLSADEQPDVVAEAMEHLGLDPTNVTHLDIDFAVHERDWRGLFRYVIQDDATVPEAWCTVGDW